MLESILASVLVPIGNAIARWIDRKAVQYERTGDKRWIARVEGYRAEGDTRALAASRVLWRAKAGAMPNDF